MKWGKVIQKGLLGLVTFVVGYLAANPEILTQLIPQNIKEMTIGGVVAALLLALRNWWKHRK